MPDSLSSSGLQTKTRAELVSEFTVAFQSIYGPDINLDPDTPDGQLMMVFVQSALDVRNLLTQVYNSMDPDNAVGNVLDQRVAINGIQRQAGTFTTTNVNITVDRALNLTGIDSDPDNPYTVADDAGNEWQLVSTVSLPSSGTYGLLFQSAVPGAIESTPNTITVPVTIVLGVTAINNPTTYAELGLNEESDSDLKIRRQRAVALGSQGYLEGLLAALENIPEVNSAFVYENVTNSTDGDGIPAHSIWVIVSGTADDEDIAQAIYQKRNAGCGMKGDETFQITQSDGSSFTVRWDVVDPETLFIRFTVTSLDGVNPPAYAEIREGLVSSFAPGVYERVNINDLATKIQEIDSNVLITNAGFGTSSTAVTSTTLLPTAKNNQFAVSEANVIILPLYLTPTSTQIAAGGSRTYATLGGFGTYTYNLQVNGSGGSIGSVTGIYVAGSSTSVVDVIRVVDQLSNSTTISVTTV